MLPLGYLTQWMRAIGAGNPGVLTTMGLGTYIDPRIEGGKMNDDCPHLLELVELGGEEYVFLPSTSVDYALLRGTTADAKGNVSLEHEISHFCTPWNAMAAANSGGEVFVQVKRVAQNGTLDPQGVRIPRFYTDVVCEVDPERHLQTGKQVYDPGYSGEIRRAVDESYPHLPFGPKKVVARRALLEMTSGDSGNVGAGMPTALLSVAVEEDVFEDLLLSVEQGNFGGLPQFGSEFGASLNPEAISTKLHMTDYYDGGGLDIAFLGFGELDQDGNVNVSNLDGRFSIGGFIDITEPTETVVFCGTLSYEPDVEIGDGSMVVHRQGKTKLVETVEQISFSGIRAREDGQDVTFVTPQAVLRLSEDGLTITELAPGVALETVQRASEFDLHVADTVNTIPPEFYRHDVVGLDAMLG